MTRAIKYISLYPALSAGLPWEGRKIQVSAEVGAVSRYQTVCPMESGSRAYKDVLTARLAAGRRRF